MTIGIFLGFGMAICFSVAYLYSREFINHYRSSLFLLVWSHLLIGIACVVILPIIWIHNSQGPFLWNAFQCTSYYMLGQFALFQAVKHTDASRVSPLLGLKILIIAVLSYFFLNHQFDVYQVVAIIISLFAALLLNWTGGKMPAASIIWVLVSCLFYSLSDIYIKKLVNCFPDQSTLHRSVLSMMIVYLMCGIFSAIALPWLKKMHNYKMVKATLPFTVIWFFGMILLFICFDLIGPVFGNLIQSTRGIFSIIFGFFVARAGYHHLETHATPRVWVQRLGAAILMSIAIGLFFFGMKRAENTKNNTAETEKESKNVQQVLVTP